MDDDTYDSIAPLEEKICRRCGEWKPLVQFYKRGKNSKYYAGYCKACHTAPFKTEQIVCPHCKERIGFFGVDTKGNVVKQKSNIISKLKKELKNSTKKKRVKNQEVKKTVKSLKDIFD